MRRKKQIHFDVPSYLYEEWREILRALPNTQTEILTALVQHFVNIQKKGRKNGLRGKASEIAVGVYGDVVESVDIGRVAPSEGNGSEIPNEGTAVQSGI